MSRLGALRDKIWGRTDVKSSYQNVFQTPDGQKVLAHILRSGKVFRPTFVAGDPHLTSFQEGQRHMALSILRYIYKNQDELMEQIERGTHEDTI